MNRLWKIFTSLRLTAVLLALSIILVFIGTIAQADEGLYQAQARYFKHWFILGITFFGHHVPVPYPGGYLLGTSLLINLLAAHIQRFQWTWKKIGIHLTHAGVILLLVGQLVTDIFSHETQMRFVEGEKKVWSESGQDYELAFVSSADANTEEVVAIPQRLLAHGGELKLEKLPFTVRIKNYWPNSDMVFRAPMQQNDAPLTTNGVARDFDFRSNQLTHSMDEKNVPTAVIEIVDRKGSLGTWVAPGWSADAQIISSLRRSWRVPEKYGPRLTESMLTRLTQPQTVETDGKIFSFTLRPVRIYRPFSLTLLKTTHEVYAGTEIPKDFRSRVRIENPQAGENRETEIFMNTPLRYAGLTFYQLQMDRQELELGGRGISVLQVVRNPGWLTPYAGCAIVAAGLITQFMMHLIGFMKKRRVA